MHWQQTEKERVYNALKNLEASKIQLAIITGIPFGPLATALDALLQDGKIEKRGMRFRRKKRR